MSQLYTPPGKASRSLLVHHGALGVNQTDGGTTPSQYLYRGGTVLAPYSLAPAAGSSPSFVDLGAGVAIASAYDEAVFDVQPVVTWDAGNAATSISTAQSAQAYADIALCGTPFWVVINPQGYGVPYLTSTRDHALNAALTVMGTIYADLQSRQMLTRFLGFAFAGADFNVMFTNFAVIDRLFQNALIQQCWAYGVGACMITSRPGDHLSLVAPVIADLPTQPPVQNHNSGRALPHPILGCNLAIRDKIVITYPLDQTTSLNGSVVMGQLAVLAVSNNRDPGVSPNLDVAYVVPFDDSMWTADGSGGLTVGSTASQAANALAFAAAYGVTSLGVMSSDSSVNVPAPIQFMPADSIVNTTGQRAMWAANGSICVAYPDGAGGTVMRAFSPSLVLANYAGPALP